MLLFYNSHKKFFTSIKLALISKACYSFISFQDSKTRSASVVHASESRASAMLLSIVLRIVCHSARRLVGQEPEPSQATGLWHAASLGVSCHYFPRLWTFQPSPPGTSTSARLDRSKQRRVELWARVLSGNLAEMTTSAPFWDLLHAANYDMGPTALLPFEGRRAEEFFVLKIRRFRPGLNPRTRLPETSTLAPRPPK